MGPSRQAIEIKEIYEYFILRRKRRKLRLAWKFIISTKWASLHLMSPPNPLFSIFLFGTKEGLEVEVFIPSTYAVSLTLGPNRIMIWGDGKEVEYFMRSEHDSQHPCLRFRLE